MFFDENNSLTLHSASVSFDNWIDVIWNGLKMAHTKKDQKWPLKKKKMESTRIKQKI